MFCVLSVGCSPAARPVRRYFWPPPPNEPKIEYLGPYTSDADLRRGHSSWFEDVVLGHTLPQTLFVQPHDVASDGRGRFFVSDVGLRRVVVCDLNKREVRYLQGDPDRDWLMFITPFALAVDGKGGVYVSDMHKGQIFYFGSDAKLRFAFGNGELERVAGLAVDVARQRLYAVDAPRNKLLVYNLVGEKQTEWGKRGGGVGEFNYPLDVDVDAAGNVYVLDALNFRVQVFDPQGNPLRHFGQLGRQLGGFQLPKGIAVDTSGHVYVSDSRAHRMLIFDLEGQLLQVIGGYGRVSPEGVSPGAFNLPSGVDADVNDGVWVADTLNRSVHRYQYLNERFLAENPIRSEEVYQPSGSDYYIPAQDIPALKK